MFRPKVYADFQNLDDSQRLLLTSLGTLRDLQRQRIELREGLCLTLYTDDEDDEGRPSELQADAVVHRDHDRADWVAVIDWSAIRHVEHGSESPASSGATLLLTPDRSAKRPNRS